jgi:hypothetical protein
MDNSMPAREFILAEETLLPMPFLLEDMPFLN